MMAVSAPRASSFGHKFKGCSSIEDYQILGKLGEGTFGEVHKATSKTSAVVALKKILLHNEKDGFPVTAVREIKLLKMLSHINILQLVEMAVERSKTKERKRAIMYMVTPYMEHDLSGMLTNPNIHITEPQIKCYMLQLLEGLKYLHGCQILHRDMKAANLLISNTGVLQIADFGLARNFDEAPPTHPGQGYSEAKRDYTALVVTRWYRPPELLLGLRRYTPAIDLWGVGCVFGEMFKRLPILQGASDVAQLHMIFDLVGSPTEDTMPGWSSLPGCEGVREFEPSLPKLNQRFREMSPAACSLMTDLLRLNWRKRITAMSALSHPYFRSHPPPAKPSELPRFEDSHELDHRKSRGQKGPPPAPAGGTVGMGPQGAAEWGGPHGTQPMQPNGRDASYNSGPPSREEVRPRGAPPGIDRYEPSQSRPRRPPAWASAGPEQQHDGHRSSAEPAPPPRAGDKDTYIPSYSRADRAPPPRRDDDRRREPDRDRERYRDRDRDTGYAYRDRSPADRDRYDRDRRPRYYDDRKRYDDRRSVGLDYGERDDRHRDDRVREDRVREDRPRDDRDYNRHRSREYDDRSWGDRSRRPTRSKSPERPRPPAHREDPYGRR